MRKIVIAISLLASIGIPETQAAIPSQTECVARTVYWEARGTSERSMLAVAQVVVNRTRHHKWPRNACEVVYQRAGSVCQFSWVCGSRRHRRPSDRDPEWMRAMYIASLAIHGVPDVTNGALYFHSSQISPGWRNLRRVAMVGGNTFYTER